MSGSPRTGRARTAKRQVEEALCRVLKRLGADGTVAFLNKEPAAKLEDQIWEHVRWLEAQEYNRGFRDGQKDPPF